MNKIKWLILFLFVGISMSVLAQRDRNYIYLLDCTASMNGYNGSPKIWNPIKAYLKAELEKHAPETSLHIIPFQGNVIYMNPVKKKPLAFTDFKAVDLINGKINWGKDIEPSLDEIVKSITNTNICAAWDATTPFMDSYKDNYIILLTDGKDNVNGMDAVAKKLSDWCGKYPNSYAFYVQLTEAAIDSNVAKVINICDNEFIVDATKGIPVFGGFDKDLVIYANTLHLEKVHQIAFSAAGRYTVKAVCQDPHFDVKVIDDKIEDGKVALQVLARQPLETINTDLPLTYDFTFDVKSDQVDIINPTIKVQMTNKPERTLDIISDQIDLGKATWYDRFLFWGAHHPDTIDVDLKAVFSDEALKDGATVELAIGDGGKGSQLLFNRQPLEQGKVVLNASANAPSILSVVYLPYANKDTLFLSAKVAAKHQLEKINGQTTDRYALSLRAVYVEKWNPLKVILTWLGIFSLALLLLWFLAGRRMIYPAISVNSIEINDPYFTRVNVKGKRRVVFTNRPMRQSLLSRVFTGEILYMRNEIWTSPLIFEAGSKGKLRVVRNRDYAFNPYTSLLSAHNDYVVENVNDKTKVSMMIN